ncbi:MAG: hypothetical protein ACRCYU_21660 [Nocardioides sp.]
MPDLEIAADRRRSYLTQLGEPAARLLEAAADECGERIAAAR